VNVSGLSFTASSTDITVTTAGTYLTSWEFVTADSGIFGVTVDGTPATGGIAEFGGGDVLTQSKSGIVSVPTSGSVVRLTNLATVQSTTLQEAGVTGATPSVASLTLTRIGP
jgi:hypothetical protein